MYYNMLIQPLLDYRLRGVIWYQGESNNGEGIQYRALLAALIRSFRAEFNNPDLAFHVVQNPPGGGGPELREAQTLAALLNKNTGLAVTTDCGGCIQGVAARYRPATPFWRPKG